MSYFYLENSIGERKDLNKAPSGSYIEFRNPSGLGEIASPGCVDIRRGFFKKISGAIRPQIPITGDLFFYNHGADPYNDFRSLGDWLHKGHDLYFIYKPADIEYHRKVELDYITKTQKTAFDILETPCSFLPLTPWYTATPVATAISPATSGYKRYPYSYSYVYPAARQNSAVQASTIGHEEAAYSLEYTGILTNPAITLTGISSGIIYGDCAITGSFSSLDTLFYTCEYLNSRVYKMAVDGTITDLIDVVDISKEVFGRIPLGETCEIRLASSTAITNAAIIKIYNYYQVV